MADIANDPRIDRRIRNLLALFPSQVQGDATSREEMVQEANFESAAGVQVLMDMCNSEENAPAKGLRITREAITSSPDGNAINLQIIRPDNDDVVPGVYYIHGGGMATMSCFNGVYSGWGKLIAANGLAVVMVDFRNCLAPSSVPDIAPFPAGLNDCLSGLHWTVEHAADLGIDLSHFIVAGESGGGNLTLACALKLKQDGQLDLVKGFYAMCPYILGQWPNPDSASSVENEGIFLTLHNNRARLGYGIEAFEAKNPLAWPSFATVDDVTGFPPVMISVNECDPLRDEGINFYRLLLEAGVAARCRQVMGTVHGTEIMNIVCPEISRATALDIAGFVRSL
jgi:acetyl esterase